MLKLASLMHLLFISLHGDIDLGVLRFHGQVHLNVLYSPARSNLFFFLRIGFIFENALCLGSEFWLLSARSHMLSVG